MFVMKITIIVLFSHQSLGVGLSKTDLEGGFVKEDLSSTVWLGHFRLTSTIFIII